MEEGWDKEKSTLNSKSAPKSLASRWSRVVNLFKELNLLKIHRLNVIVNLVCLILYILYCYYVNDTNHSSFDFVYLCMGLSLVNIFLYVVILMKKQKFNSLIIVSFIIQFVFFVLIGFNAKMNIMMSYEKWTKKGMPEKYERDRKHLDIH